MRREASTRTFKSSEGGSGLGERYIALAAFDICAIISQYRFRINQIGEYDKKSACVRMLLLPTVKG